MAPRVPIRPGWPGTIYLLHYSARTTAARRHYLGWTRDVERRVARHRAGGGSKETSRAVGQGLLLTLAQSWRGTPSLESELKEWSRAGHKGFAAICPFCDGDASALPSALVSALGEPSLRRYVVARGRNVNSAAPSDGRGAARS